MGLGQWEISVDRSIRAIFRRRRVLIGRLEEVFFRNDLLSRFLYAHENLGIALS